MQIMMTLPNKDKTIATVYSDVRTKRFCDVYGSSSGQSTSAESKFSVEMFGMKVSLIIVQPSSA